MEVIIKPAGQVPPKVEKRAAESILYTLNCSELVDSVELITGANVTSSYPGITFSDIRTRKGKNIEVRVENEAITAAQYTDFTVQVMFTTTFNNKKLAVFQLRVYK